MQSECDLFCVLHGEFTRLLHTLAVRSHDNPRPLTYLHHAYDMLPVVPAGMRAALGCSLNGTFERVRALCETPLLLYHDALYRQYLLVVIGVTSDAGWYCTNDVLT